MTSKLTERMAVVSCIDPDAYASGATYTGDNVDMSKWGRIMAICMVGTLGASATIDYKLQASEDGTNFYDIDDITPDKLATQLTQAGTDDDKQVIIELSSAELEQQSKADSRKYRYVRDSLTVGTATSDCGSVVLGGDPRFGPASDDELSTVDETLDGPSV